MIDPEGSSYYVLMYKLGRRNGVFVIGASKTISNLKIEDAVNKISESKYGLHCLLIYPNLPTFRNFYTRYIKRQIDYKNEIVLLNRCCVPVFFQLLNQYAKTLTRTMI